MRKVKAISDYEAQYSDELNIKYGEIIEVIEDLDSDWSKGRLNGNEGIFPISFTEPYTELEVPQSNNNIKSLNNMINISSSNINKTHIEEIDDIPMIRKELGNVRRQLKTLNEKIDGLKKLTSIYSSSTSSSSHSQKIKEQLQEFEKDKIQLLQTESQLIERLKKLENPSLYQIGNTSNKEIELKSRLEKLDVQLSDIKSKLKKDFEAKKGLEKLVGFYQNDPKGLSKAKEELRNHQEKIKIEQNMKKDIREEMENIQLVLNNLHHEHQLQEQHHLSITHDPTPEGEVDASPQDDIDLSLGDISNLVGAINSSTLNVENDPNATIETVDYGEDSEGEFNLSEIHNLVGAINSSFIVSDTSLGTITNEGDNTTSNVNTSNVNHNDNDHNTSYVNHNENNKHNVLDNTSNINSSNMNNNTSNINGNSSFNVSDIVSPRKMPESPRKTSVLSSPRKTISVLESSPRKISGQENLSPPRKSQSEYDSTNNPTHYTEPESTHSEHQPNNNFDNNTYRPTINPHNNPNNNIRKVFESKDDSVSNPVPRTRDTRSLSSLPTVNYNKSNFGGNDRLPPSNPPPSNPPPSNPPPSNPPPSNPPPSNPPSNPPPSNPPSEPTNQTNPVPNRTLPKLPPNKGETRQLPLPPRKLPSPQHKEKLQFTKGKMAKKNSESKTVGVDRAHSRTLPSGSFSPFKKPPPNPLNSSISYNPLPGRNVEENGTNHQGNFFPNNPLPSKQVLNRGSSRVFGTQYNPVTIGTSQDPNVRVKELEEMVQLLQNQLQQEKIKNIQLEQEIEKLKNK